MARKKSNKKRNEIKGTEDSPEVIEVESETSSDVPRASSIANVRREESEGFISEHEGVRWKGGHTSESEDSLTPRGRKGARQRYAKTLKKMTVESPKVSEAEDGGNSSGKEIGLSDEERPEVTFTQEELDERLQAINECAIYLGIDPTVETELLWIAEEALLAPLPDGWSEAIDENGDPYYFNEKTGYSTWEHPMDAYYQSLVSRVKSDREKDSTVNDTGPRQSEKRATDSLGEDRSRSRNVAASSEESEVETDSEYDQHDKAVMECARYLGILPKTERHLLWIAEEALYAPLPEGWEEGEENGDPYFYNSATGDTIWEHPMDPYYRELVIKEREKGDMSDDGTNRGGGFSSAESGTEASRRLRRKRFRRKPDGSLASESEAEGSGRLVEEKHGKESHSSSKHLIRSPQRFGVTSTPKTK